MGWIGAGVQQICHPLPHQHMRRSLKKIAVVTFLICFLNLCPSIVLLPQAHAGINSEGLGPPIWSQSEQIWKSGNCDSGQEGASKSSLRGHLVVVVVVLLLHDLYMCPSFLFL